MASPTITIGTPSRTKISRKSGYDRAIVTFQSDIALNNWEARATTAGQTIGHGSGLLVESGGSLAANINATVYVDDEELTEGDRVYTITVHGHGKNGYWSDGTYEAINVFDPTRDVVFWYYVSLVDNAFIFETNNHIYTGVVIDLYLHDELQRTAFSTSEDGDYSFVLAKDTSFDLFNILVRTDYGHAVVDVNTAFMENGYNYQFSFSVETLPQNQVAVRDFTIVKVVT